jgi:transcriptional antiterminator NusG
VLVEMEMTDETWHLVKNTAKVTGFVGGARNRPTPISPKEVEKIMSQMQEGVEKPRPKTLFEVGEMVRQGRPVHGLQRHRRGSQLREVARACVGHDLWPATPVELEFGQVEKV